MLSEGIPNLDTVAKKLALSTRNLQNKLKEEGTTFRTLLDDIRRDTAIHYLSNDGDASIAEISYLLGFSEPSVFHRTFKRWTNHSPGEYRKTQQ